MNAGGESLVSYLRMAFSKTRSPLDRRIETILRHSITSIISEGKNREFINRIDEDDISSKVRSWRTAILKVPSSFGSREPTKTVVDDLLSNLNLYLEHLFQNDVLYDRNFTTEVSFFDHIYEKNLLSCAQLSTNYPFTTINRVFMNVSPAFRQHMYIRQTSDTDAPRYAVSILEFHNQIIGNKHFEFFTLITSRSAGTGDGQRILYVSAGDVLGSRDVLICLCCLQSADHLDIRSLIEKNSARVLVSSIWYEMLFEETETIRTFNLKAIQASCYSGVAFIKDTDHSTAISPAFTIPISEKKAFPLNILCHSHGMNEIKSIIMEYKDPTTGSNYSSVVEDFVSKSRSTISH